MFKDFYHLKAEPFSTHPNPGVIFISNTHKEAWYYLLFGIDTQEPFLVLTGEYGMGKTLLCLRLIQVLKKKNKPPVEYISTPGEGYGGILRRIAHSLNIGVIPEDEAILQDMIYDYFRAETHDARFYLIIDDAHELDTETLTRLKHLSSFNHNGFFPIVMIFVAHPSFLKDLRTPALSSLNQRIKRRFSLSRFSFDDTKNYIYFRLLKSGAAGVPTFPEETFQKIYEFSGGVPRLINNICDTCLLIGASRGVTSIHPSIVDDAKKLVEGSPAGNENEPVIKPELKTETPGPVITISEETSPEVAGDEDINALEIEQIENDAIQAPPIGHSAFVRKLRIVAMMLAASIILLICGGLLFQWYLHPDFTLTSLVAGIRRAHTPTAVTADVIQKSIPEKSSASSAVVPTRRSNSAPAVEALPAVPVLRDESEKTSPASEPPKAPAVSQASVAPQPSITAPPAQAQPAETTSPAASGQEAPPNASHDQPDVSVTAYPFSLRTSSYQLPAHAQREMSGFQKKGLPTYLVRVNLGDMGIWWRIYIGCYSTETQALQVMKKYGLSHAIVEKTPYACLTGDYASEEDTLAAFEKLKRDGFYPYVIQKDKNHLMLFVGAYDKMSDAGFLHRELQDKGIRNHITAR